MRGLGFRNDKVRFDIEFPTRNHLKVFLAKLIAKRRRQLEAGLCDIASQSSTAIISSTDYCEDKVVSHLCKSVFTPRHGDAGILGAETSGRQSPAKFAGSHGGGFSNYAGSPSRYRNRSIGAGGQSGTTRRYGGNQKY